MPECAPVRFGTPPNPAPVPKYPEDTALIDRLSSVYRLLTETAASLSGRPGRQKKIPSRNIVQFWSYRAQAR